MSFSYPVTGRRAAALARIFIASLCLLLAGVGQLKAEPVKIGVVGAGNVGSTIGSLWIEAGHQVMFSSLDLDALKPLLAKLGPRASLGTAKEAAAFGDVIFVAVPYGALPQLGRDLADVWRGKIVLDAGNAVSGRENAALIADVARRGIGVVSAEALPGTRLVRVFSNLSYQRFRLASRRSPERVAMPFAADDAQAVRMTEMLVEDAGFDPVHIGGLDKARLLQQGEPAWKIAREEPSAADLRARLGLKPKAAP